jgi:ankyrin repeat protein
MGKIYSITGIYLLAVFVLGATVTFAGTTNVSEIGTLSVFLSLVAESRGHQVADKVFTSEALGEAFGSYLDAGKDVDGDGYSDLLIGAPRYSSKKGRAYLFYGGPNMDTKSDKVFMGEEVGDLFGTGVVLEDINGDRFADVIVGAPGHNSEQGRVYVFHGGPEMDTNPDKVFSGEQDTSAGFGQWLNVGDLNGDQRPDLTVSARGWDNFRGRIYVFYGAPGEDIDTTADMILDGENPGDRFGCKHTLGNDVNGDRYQDLVVGAESWPNDNQQGRAYLYYGGPDMDTAPDVIFTGEAGKIGGQFGYANELSDIDRDSFVDIIIGAPSSDDSRGRAYLFFGGPDMDNIADRIFRPEGSSGPAQLGTAIACGHVNRDGHTDIALGSPGHSDYTGQACVHHGGPGRSMDQIPDKVFEGEMSRSYFGAPVKLADLNGDYTHDLLVAANTYIPVQGRFQGRVYLYHGEPLPVTKKFIPGLEDKPTKSIFQAAAEGDIKQVKLHISSSTNVNERTVSGDTALHYAAKDGHKDVAELLIARGANINAENAAGETPLHYTARGGHKDIAELLIEKGATISTIHVAAFMGELAKVKAFLQRGIDTNAQDSDGRTPLHCAATADVAGFLISNGADIHAEDKEGETPLHTAARVGCKDVVELLIAEGVDVNVESGSRKRTPLYWAVKNDHKDVAKLLIEKGADVSSGHLLYYVCSHGHRDLAEFLIRKGADANSKYWGESPSHYAVWGNHADVLELLLAHGADANAKDRWGWSLLHYAAGSGSTDITKMLLDKGAEPNVREDKGAQTPLHRAVEEGHITVAKLLIANGADVNAKDKEGRTPLLHAQDRGHTEIVELLRKHGTKE